MSINKKHIPEDYFQKFPDNLEMEINNLDDNVAQEAPLLYKTSQKASYLVPEGYFEGLYDNIILKKSQASQTVFMLKPFLVAASLVAVIMLSWIFLADQNRLEVDDLMIADVYDYYINNIEEIDNSMILDIEGIEISIEENEFSDLSEDELNLYQDALLENMQDHELLSIL